MTKDIQSQDSISGDLDDTRQEHLQLLMTVTGLLALPMLALDLHGNVPGIPISVILLAVVGAVKLLRNIHASRAASLVYIVGLVLVPIMQINVYGPTSNAALLIFLPVIICGLLFDRNGVCYTAEATLAAVFLTSCLKTDFPTTLNFILLPGFMCAVLTVTLYLNEGSIMDMVYWAMDVQRKDTRRAEMFYEQKVQLSEAVLQVQHANSKLEQVNAQLEIAQQKAEQASQTKSTFLSNMSHELRTPLNIVIGYSSSMLTMPQMFDNVALPEIYRPYLKLIEDNGHYLLGLINDILDLSKIEAGKLELHPTPVDLPELLRGTLSTSIGLLKDKPLQIRPDFPNQLPMVWADPLRVRQIILNLMSNAIKFTHTGSVTLAARVNDGCVQISVSDTGIGIPEKALATIFDRFQQAEHDTDKHYGGTGLGLDISKQLSLMHGGDLMVESISNQGSTFSFTLPIAEVDQLSPGVPIDVIDDTLKIFANTGSMVSETQTILLVEDETNTREMLHSALTSAGYVVVDAHEGEQAFELASGLLPDLILMDVYLPGIDGWDLLTLLKADIETEHIPVVMFTAAPEPERAYEMGAALVLKKPLTPHEIIANVQSILTPVSK